VGLAQHLAADRQRLLVERLGLPVLALALQVEGQVVVAKGRAWVCLAQRLAPDCQRLPEQWLSLAVLALGIKVAGQVEEA
jgi:hypothetical protein